MRRAHQLQKRIKSFVGYGFFGLGLHRALLSEVGLIVAFHRVNDLIEDGLTCNTQMFNDYCRFLADHFRVVKLGSLVEKLEQGVPLDREAAITFDDGYRDNYELATPVLTALRLPATFFVVSEFIGTDFVPWWDRDLPVRQAWMTWDQVQTLQRGGFDIGVHTRTHVDLGKTSGDQSLEEIAGARRDLERKLSITVEHFAYPYGQRDNITSDNRAIVKEVGLRCCCSCFGGLNTADTDPFHLRRVPISSWYASPHHFGFETARAARLF